jgi:hypothetical protein
MSWIAREDVRNDNAMVFLIGKHVTVHVISDPVDMGRVLEGSTATVALEGNIVGEGLNATIGVHRHKHVTNIRLNNWHGNVSQGVRVPWLGHERLGKRT